MRYGSILVATDFSDSALAAMRAAAAIVRSSPSRLEVLHVHRSLRAPEPDAAIAESDVVGEAPSESELARLHADELGDLSLELRTVVHASPAEAIIDEARRFDLCVVGSHGRTGLTRLLLGSVSERVVRHATCDVLVARGEPAPPWRNLVAAVDFSDDSVAAAVAAGELATRLGAVLTLVHVVDPASPIARRDAPGVLSLSEMRHRAEGKLADMISRHLPASGAKAEVLGEASASDRLVSYTAHHRVDLLVVGTHGHTALARLLIGSVSERLVRLAPCSTLVVRSRA
jgi:nucleotide-binding universal stress UspA family protein